MRVEINILTPTEAQIYVNLDDPYTLSNHTGGSWKLVDSQYNEVRRWKCKDTDTVKNAIPEALRLIFLRNER